MIRAAVKYCCCDYHHPVQEFSTVLIPSNNTSPLGQHISSFTTEFLSRQSDFETTLLSESQPLIQEHTSTLRSKSLSNSQSGRQHGVRETSPQGDSSDQSEFETVNEPPTTI